MERIEVPSGMTYLQAKQNAGMLMMSDPLISSVRVLVEKGTCKMWVEVTKFPQKTVDKLTKM
ncbi:MAG: hypothetical protein J6S32_03295 [Clostridia bacterium]|nr:hypothetical protein [Clostridia bacterium]